MSDKLGEQKSEVKLEKKMKENHPDFYEKVMGLGREQLNKEVQVNAKGAADDQAMKEDDDELTTAREEYNSLNRPYTERQKLFKEKIRFLRNRLKELGEE